MSERRNPTVIKVSGDGIVERPAELAEFRIQIEESGDDPAELMQAVVVRHNNVLEVLQAELYESEITARGTMIRKHEKSWWVDDDKEAPPEPAFDGASEIWVRTDKLEIVGLLMTRAMAVGASSVSQARFMSKDSEAATVEAITQATNAARLRAQTVAHALGLVLGPPAKLESGCSADGYRGGRGAGFEDISTFVGSARAMSFGGPSDGWDIEEPTIIPANLVTTESVYATFELLEPDE